MKNKIVLLIVLILLVIITGIAISAFNNGKNSNDNNIIKNAENFKNNTSENSIKNEIKESEEKMNTKIKITIEDKTYNAILEQNETAKQFFDMLPQEFYMNELNGNEKYIYLNTILTTNAYNPKHIESGDIMLYGNNCLVIFYKSFDTLYSYTKIGHIENFENIGNKDMTIKFEGEK